MAEIPVSGDVLVWAREFRGLTLSEAAERLKLTPAELEAIETETKKPTLTQFEQIATTYKLPTATLFLKKRPKEPTAPTDFRTFEGGQPHDGFDFRVAISNVRRLQGVLHALREDDDSFITARLRQYNGGGDPFIQGEAERREIGVAIRRQLEWPAEDGFRHWRAIVERLGVAVYVQKFDVNDSLGFSMVDDAGMPVIVVNKSKQSENAKVFTLIHEYAHLLIRKPGISDLKNANPVEAFCNRFAAAFLMPVAALRQLLPEWPDKPKQWADETIWGVARQLKVSGRALAIRLEELGKAPDGFNRRFARTVKAKDEDDDKDIIVKYPTKRLAEIGGHFTASVMAALDRAIIDNVHACQALGLKPENLEKARAYVERQRELARLG